MDLWAFATSRWGLGLTERRFWSLTRREYAALRKVYLQAHGVRIDSPNAGPQGWPAQSVDEKKMLIKAGLETAVAMREIKKNQKAEAEQRALEKSRQPRRSTRGG